MSLYPFPLAQGKNNPETHVWSQSRCDTYPSDCPSVKGLFSPLLRVLGRGCQLSIFFGERESWGRLPWWLSWWRTFLQRERPGYDPWVGKFPWRREWLPMPVFWPGEFHGLYSPWGCKESDTTEQLLHFTSLQGWGGRQMLWVLLALVRCLDFFS